MPNRYNWLNRAQAKPLIPPAVVPPVPVAPGESALPDELPPELPPVEEIPVLEEPIPEEPVSSSAALEERPARARRIIPRGVGQAAGSALERISDVALPSSSGDEDEEEEEDFSDIFDAPAPDGAGMKVNDLLSADDNDVTGADGPEDMSDILGVDDEDVIGEDGSDDMSDILGTDEEDVIGESSSGESGSDDMSDVLDVDEEDILGETSEPERPPRQRQVRRTTRRYTPPAGMGGIQY